jgi:hypothetical protein
MSDGDAATIATQNYWIFGVRAKIYSPLFYHARGVDSENYFSAYVGFFVDQPRTSFVEAGLMFWGDTHLDKNMKMRAAQFKGTWAVILNPIAGALFGEKPQRQRNVAYDGPTTVDLELTLNGRNEIGFTVNGQPFKSIGRSTFGYGPDGISQETFNKGMNVKACLGFADRDGTIAFAGFGIEITELRVFSDAKKGVAGGFKWVPPFGISPRISLEGVTQIRTGLYGHRLINIPHEIYETIVLSLRRLNKIPNEIVDLIIRDYSRAAAGVRRFTKP